MRVVLQRVAGASVTIDGAVRASIDRGLLVLVGFTAADTPADAAWMAEKVRGLRIFGDGAGKMNLDVGAVGGSVLVVSQFTLYGMRGGGDVRRSRCGTAQSQFRSMTLSSLPRSTVARGDRRVRGRHAGGPGERWPCTLILDHPADDAATIVLASASPRRKQLLEMLRLRSWYTRRTSRRLPAARVARCLIRDDSLATRHGPSRALRVVPTRSSCSTSRSSRSAR